MQKSELERRFEVFFQHPDIQEKGELELAYYLDWFFATQIHDEHEYSSIIPELPSYIDAAMRCLREELSDTQVRQFRREYLEVRGEREIPDLTDASYSNTDRQPTIAMLSRLMQEVTGDNSVGNSIEEYFADTSDSSDTSSSTGEVLYERLDRSWMRYTRDELLDMLRNHVLHPETHIRRIGSDEDFEQLDRHPELYRLLADSELPEDYHDLYRKTQRALNIANSSPARNNLYERMSRDGSFNRYQLLIMLRSFTLHRFELVREVDSNEDFIEIWQHPDLYDLFADDELPKDYHDLYRQAQNLLR